MKTGILNIRLRLLRWLSLLLLSAGIAARSQLVTRYRWFRRPHEPDLYYRKIKLKKIQASNQLKRLTMKIRIRLLRWLNLLQLSACLGGQMRELSHTAFFRRT